MLKSDKADLTKSQIKKVHTIKLMTYQKIVLDR